VPDLVPPIPVPEPPVRPDPPQVAPEREALQGWLDFHRATLLLKCAGLTADQLVMRSCPPSTLSLLGLVRHLTDVERGWFLRRWVAGVTPLYWGPDNLDGDFDDLDPARAADEVAAYRSAVDACRAEAARHDLAEVVLRHPQDPAAEDVIDVRWIYLHLIEEYARHNGHADLLRQAIDGAIGE
jgi:Protein of unknown function (DUF664)